MIVRTKNLLPGFTLIELLIVIVIIGILSTLVIANFVGVRARARDAQRKTDLAQIRTALQLYYSDEGAYPGWNGGTNSPSCGLSFSGSTGITYIQKMPCDPHTKERYIYTPSPLNCWTTETCTGYTLKACLENTSDADSDVKQQGGGGNTCSNNLTSYTVTNP
jgi:general secretion pathway protein G